MNFNHFDKEKSELKFKGILALTYQRKFPKGIFEYVVLPDSVRVFGVTKDRKILAIKETSFSHKDAFYSLPGGKIDEGEDPMFSAKRELEEETGYTSDDLEFWFDNNYSQTIISRKYFFIARNCIKKGDAKLESTENIETEELTFDEFLEKALADNFRHMELQNKFFKMKLSKDYREEFLKKCLL